MKLYPSDPNLATLIDKIGRNRIDLQPDFQRGEVWSRAKKARLIDTILRDWHIPPIHVVVDDEAGIDEVLDGQQRLVAIRDFVDGKFTVDGKIQPENGELIKLHRMKYGKLPERYKERFNDFTIRYLRITEYAPEEPGELFLRLNQPTNLTSAEKRNSLYGKVRQQIKSLVRHAIGLGVDRKLLGFANTRMAYDDTLARVCVSLEQGTLRKKVTARQIETRFRQQKGFDVSIVSKVESALETFAFAGQHADSVVRFNKATFFSWLWVFASMGSVDNESKLAAFMCRFERSRLLEKRGIQESGDTLLSSSSIDETSLSVVLEQYTDRASSRVADVSSVLIRNLAIWIALGWYMQEDFLKQAIQSPQMKVSLQRVLDCLERANDGEEVRLTLLEAVEKEPVLGSAI